MTLSPKALATLDRLREEVDAMPPWEGQGHLIAPPHPGGLHTEHKMVWLPLRHAPEGREPYEHALALMPTAALERPEEALLRLRVWAEVLRKILSAPLPRGAPLPLSLGLLDRPTLAKKKRVKSREALLEAYYADRSYGRLLPAPQMRDERGRTAAQIALDALEACLPARGGIAEIQLAPPFDEETDAVRAVAGAGLRATIRLIVWEVADGHRSVRDIKEQEVFLLPPSALLRLDRIELTLRAWAEALEVAFAEAPLAKIEVRMPYDFAFPEVFELKSKETVEALREAFLARSRLGALRASGG